MRARCRSGRCRTARSDQTERRVLPPVRDSNAASQGVDKRMTHQESPDPRFDAMTARLLRREALRRAAEEVNTTSGPGLEGVLAQISEPENVSSRRRISRV